MAGELQVDFISGRTVYFQIRNSIGQIWNTAGTPAFEAYATANIGDYDVAATEQGTASGYYAGNMPALVAGIYYILAKERAGASPAEADITAGSGTFRWTGYSFVDMTEQVWRRQFKRATLTSTLMRTFDDDGSTVRTSQVVSDDGTTQVQGAAT